MAKINSEVDANNLDHNFYLIKPILNSFEKNHEKQEGIEKCFPYSSHWVHFKYRDII